MSPVTRHPLTRSRKALARRTKVKRVNRNRRKKEWARAYGSKERVAFVQSLPSVAGGIGPCENAHIVTGGMGRKADYCLIVPLTPEEHRDLHVVGPRRFEELCNIDLEACAAFTEAAWLAYSGASLTPSPETVTLKWEETLAGAIDKHEWSCDEPPTPSFKAALAAFAPYVVDLIQAPAEWGEMDIRQLLLKEEDAGARGLTVTALRKCERARNRTLLLNSPYMASPPGDYTGDGAGFLDDTVLALIGNAEELALAYRLGERGEQITMDLDSDESDTADEFNERAAAAEVASTRKPRGRKKAQEGVMANATMQ